MTRWHLPVAKVAAMRTGVICAVVAALEILRRLGTIDRVTMIPPSEMASSLWDIIRSGRFNSDIFFTLYNVTAAAVLAIAAGFFIGAGFPALPRPRRVGGALLGGLLPGPPLGFYPFVVCPCGVRPTPLVVP